jgi:hypothetical protein
LDDFNIGHESQESENIDSSNVPFMLRHPARASGLREFRSTLNHEK